MEKYTDTLLHTSWGDMEVVRARSKRGPGSSAPTPEEVKIYEIMFKAATFGKKKTRTLVLGATPELRDMAIGNGSETYAVDISPRLLLSMTNVMKQAYSFNNKYLVGDWLNMIKLFKPGSFDVILGDASFNNVPFSKWNTLFTVCKKLLAERGCLITRQIVIPKQRMKPWQDIIDDCNKGRQSISGLLFEAGFLTEFLTKCYDPGKRKFDWSKMSEEFEKQVIPKLSRDKRAYAINHWKHAKYHSSYITTPREFRKLASRHFNLVKVVVSDRVPHSYLLPMYMFRAKQSIIRYLMRGE